MRLSMTLNLQKSGFQVFAYDVNKGIYEELHQKGISCCDSIINISPYLPT